MSTRKTKTELQVLGNNAKRIEPNQFKIVGIGASAGGLEALKQFFENMPPDSGLAFVIVQHLDPNHFGMMPELLQRITKMKVLQATEKLKVKPNCVYVIPPNKSLTILNGVLYLFNPIESHGLRLPVDIFFKSLALDMLDKSIGIILSGMGSDGTIGIKAIKDQNGLTLIQDPNTAKFYAMPKSALDNVNIDIVATAEELPIKLLDYITNRTSNTENVNNIDRKNNSSIEKIIILLRDQCGHDFTFYKKTTLIRRIERRKGIHQFEKIQNYVHFLQENPLEVEILFKELLIGVTSFFRDIAIWDKLKDEVLPEFIKELPNGYVIRVWITGCSTGEEAYSWAIIFKEVIETICNKKIKVQIFATDLDKDAIEKARRGIYYANIENDMTKDRLSKYFTAENENYRINPSIREMVIFAPQNLIKDPPFTKLDILSCRNLLIYMEFELQKKVLALFHYSLKNNGILLLGTAETIGNKTEGYKDLDSRLKIYKRIPAELESSIIDFPISYFHSKTMTTEKQLPTKDTQNIQVLAEQILLQRFTPASVLVYNGGDIVYITGRTGKYLEPIAGKANWNIYAMARENLRHELPGAFRKAQQSPDPVILKNIKIDNDGVIQLVDVTIQRIDSPESIKGMIILVFNDINDIVISETETKIGTVNKNGHDQYISSKQKELEFELKKSLEELQSAREEMQTSQEELKSANEELQSTNEEVQSMNEELQTVNIELQVKINDLVRANDDMKNLLNSTEIATLFLDSDLNIRKYTDQVVKIFKMRSADIGRPFTEVVSDLMYPEISDDAFQVLKSLKFIETATETNDGRWFNVRIMPYRTLNDQIDGLVITFSDITIAKKIELKLKEANLAMRPN